MQKVKNQHDACILIQKQLNNFRKTRNFCLAQIFPCLRVPKKILEKFYLNMQSSDFSFNVMEDEDVTEIEYNRIVEELPRSEILGNSYKPTRKHRLLPKIEIKPTLGNVRM